MDLGRVRKGSIDDDLNIQEIRTNWYILERSYIYLAMIPSTTPILEGGGGAGNK
jgi:hypothetical protein